MSNASDTVRETAKCFVASAEVALAEVQNKLKDMDLNDPRRRELLDELSWRRTQLYRMKVMEGTDPNSLD